MLEKYHKLQPKPKTTDELKAALQTIWEELPQNTWTRNKAVYLYLVANKPALSRATNRLPVKAMLKTLRNDGGLIWTAK